MTQRFTVVVEIDAENNTAQAFGEFNKGVESAGKSSKLLDGVMNAVGQRLVGLAERLPEIAAETFQLGVASEAATLRFQRFAGSEERATELLGAFQEATGGTVDKLGAMSSAARLLQMDLVGNADEMATVAEIATKLGDQTLGATDRISDFSLLLANQSIPRLDNFGISSGKVRARIKELQAATKDMSREEAFKIAVMEEGRRALDTLGDTTDLTSTKIDKLKAAVQDAKIGFGEIAVEAIGATEGVDKFAASIRALPDHLRTFLTFSRAAGEVQKETNTRMLHASAHYEDIENKVKQMVAAQTDFNHVSEETRWAIVNMDKQIIKLDEDLGDGRRAFDQYTQATDESAVVTYDAVVATTQYEKALRESEDALDTAIMTSDEWRREQQKQQETMLETAQVALDAAMQFTDFYEGVAEKQADFAEKREAIEDEHTANMEELRQRAQDKYITIDEEAERLKLEITRQKLIEALAEREAFNEETSELTKLRNQEEISELEAALAKQHGILESANEGRLRIAGENVDALIAEEDRRHQAAIAGLEEEMQKTQELQEQQMGQLLLQTFDQWAEIGDVPPDKMLEMRTAIAQEYGLISEEQALMVTSAIRKWEEWATSADTSAQETVTAVRKEIDAIADLTEELGRLPTEKEITIRIKVEEERVSREVAGISIPEFAEPGRGGGLLMQHGTPFFQGGMALVGEQGPELAILPRGTAIMNNTQTRAVTNNNYYSMEVNTRAQQSSVIQDFEMMRAMAG